MTDAKRSKRLAAVRKRDADRLEASLGGLPKAVRRPALIILIGLPGSGKSYFARRLAKRYPAAILDSDALRGALYESPQHTAPENARLFPATHVLTRRLLDRGVPVVLDATNLKESNRKPLYRLAREANARLVTVRLRAPFAVMRERLAKRDAARDPLDRSTAGLLVLERMRRDYQRPRRPYFVVDTSKDARQVLDKIVARLQS
ncbi:MAG: ATP-binding protein [Chloroflexi bacterium]|nr:ATP-binding protein [Chloroflexota bacterium]